MKIDIFIFISSLLLFPLVTPCSAQDSMMPEAALDIAQRERSAQPAAYVPPWKASLGDIQQTTADLIAASNRLRDEYQQLDREIQTAGQAILAQKDRNKEQTLTLMQRQRDLSAPDPVSTVGIESIELENAVIQKRQALQLLRARDRGLQNRVELDRIRTRELDVEKKALLVDLKAKNEVSSEEIRTEIAGLQAEIAKQGEQEAEIWRKISAMPRGPDEALSEAQSLTFEIVDMKMKLSNAAAQEQKAYARISELRAQRKQLEADPVIAAYNRQLEDKKNTSALIVDQQRSISEYKKARNSGRRTISELKDKFGAVEKQNKGLMAEAENLRENIALLEYKINSIQNGQDRNKQKGR